MNNYSFQNPEIMERCSSQQLFYKQMKDMKKKNLVGALWEIVNKMSRKKEKKDKQNENTVSEFSQNINRGALACFSELCTELACNNKITEVNLSRCNINIYFAIELANLVQKNTNIQVLQLAGCNLNSFSLGCIFKSMIDHTGLTHLNLQNNKGFTVAAVEDFCKYVLQGKNPLIEINLSLCNIDNTSLSLILANLKHLKSLKRLIISLVNFNYSECILALSSALLNYTGNNSLEYLDISWNRIQNHGIELLSAALFMSVRQINIRSLNLEYNQLTQDCIQSLETIMLRLNAEEINLSKNKISEFQNQQVLSKKMSRIDLSHNRFEEIPNNFFLNVLSLNLSNNSIKTQGAYQISQVLSSKKVLWMELNLNSNEIGTSGFISLIYALIENQHLISLSAANNNISGEGILVYIFNHEQLNLEHLDLSLNNLRYDLVYALISMMKECKLRSLMLSKLTQDGDDIKSVKEELFEIKCTNLREIDFSGNYIMINSILSSLSQQYNRIEYLNLNHCEINQKHLLEALSSFLSRTFTLSTLMLARNNLGKVDEIYLKILSDGLSNNQSLTYLDISSNKLKIKILCLIHGLANCRYLKYLNISNNLIYETRNIIHDFPKIFTNPSLQRLDISMNQIGGQTLLQSRKVLYKQYKQFPQVNLSKQQFTADDLHIITQILTESQTIRSLELADNDSLNYMNNVMTFGNNVRVESLSINKILFRQDSFANLLNVIELNFKHIRILEISNTLLFCEQLIQLLQSIKLIKNLQIIILDYQSFKERDIEVLIALQDCLQAFKNLKHFSVRKSTLSLQFYCFVSELLSKSQKLQELDLSGNVIGAADFQVLCEGLNQNYSLTTLNLRNCKINEELFLMLAPCIQAKSSIKYLDLSQNEITTQILNKFGPDYITSIQTLKLENIQIYWDIIEIQDASSLKKTFQNLVHIDLSRNDKQNDNFLDLLDTFVKQRIFINIQILSLNYCGIMDDQCSIVANLIQDNSMIQDISLIGNRIQSKGFEKIFESIINNSSSLKKLNISKNSIDDQYFKDLTPAKIIPLSNFRLLIIDSNRFEGYSTTGITNFLQKNPRTYVYNNWCNVNEKFAKLIIEQLVLFTSDYNLNKEVPQYLTSLIIRDTMLSDEFFIWFGSKYFRLSFLEFVDFRGSSKLMTSMSKMHMYINIINENFVNYNLIEVSFDQNLPNQQPQQSCYFDDGLLKYFLLFLKVFFQNKNHISSQRQGYVVNEIEKVRWGKLGKWIVHLINTSLNFINNAGYDFRFSSSLHSYSRQHFTQIKMSMIAGTMIQYLKIILGVGIVTMKGLNEKLPCQNECFYNDITSSIQGILILNSMITFCQSCFGLLWAIKIRLQATPDYCIQTSEMTRYQHFKFPHKNEIWLFLLSLTTTINYSLYCRILGRQFELLDVIDATDSTMNLQNMRSNAIINISLLISLIIIITLFDLYFTTKTMLIFLNTQRGDEANYLQSCLVKVQTDNMLNLESILGNYCPQLGICIKGKLWNFKQLLELIYGTIELLVLIIMIQVQNHNRKLLKLIGFEGIMTTTDLLMLLILIKCFIKLIKHLFCALMSRPPQLNVQDLNEALLLRRYEKLGHSLTLTQKIPKKQLKSFSSQQNIPKKNSLDIKLAAATNTKSDRSIVLKKGPSFQLIEDIDYIPENIQIPMDPIKNKSMRNIQLKYL